MLTTWYSGLDDYKEHSLTVTNEGQHFHTVLRDVKLSPLTNIDELFYRHLENRTTEMVEVLFSGGVDSELVIRSCLQNKITVSALTMKIMVNGYTVNTHDLYYAEKACRELGVSQRVVVLDAGKFFDSGELLELLAPYRITEPHVATHLWLLNQTTGFAVIGGDHSWPWSNQPIISPHRHAYCCYDRYMKDQGISGIGNMIGHSIDTDALLIRTHLSCYDPNIHGTQPLLVSKLKHDMYSLLGHTMELRFRSYGWEKLDAAIFDLPKYRSMLEDHFGKTTHSISWESVLAATIGAVPGTNFRFN